MYQHLPQSQSANSILWVEGEKSVQACWLNGLGAVTPQGSCWTDIDLKRYVQQLRMRGIHPIIIPDADLAGLRKRDKLIKVLEQQGWYGHVLDLRKNPSWVEGWDMHELLWMRNTKTLLWLYRSIVAYSKGTSIKGVSTSNSGNPYAI
jgi:hypothetical protein